MIEQRLNPFTAGAQVRQCVDQVEARRRQTSRHHGIERHEVMVSGDGLAMERNRTDETPAIARNSESEGMCPLPSGLTPSDLQDAYARAIDAAHLDDKGAAAVLQISPGQLSRQLRGEPNYHLSCQRLALLSRDAQVAFVVCLAQRLGLDVVTPDADALALGEMLQAIGRVMPRFRMLRAPLAPVADRRRA